MTALVALGSAISFGWAGWTARSIWESWIDIQEDPPL